ncbi:MAG TPA: hypothetical protein VJ597_05925 [Sphingomicrobium sp.]|nr:hypothetical protein [Sphingomicrobium sp.]
MTRLILAAGVAALAITAPASAKPDRGGGHDRAQVVKQQGGGERAQRGQKAQRVERAGHVQRSERTSVPQMEGRQRAERRMERPQRFSAFQEQRRERRAERVKPRRVEQFQGRSAERPERIERQNRGLERRQVRENRIERIQNRGFERRQARDNRQQRFEDRLAIQNQRELRRDRSIRFDDRGRRFSANAVGYGIDGCPPGLISKGCMPPGQALQANRIVNADAFRESRFAALTLGDRRILSPFQAVEFVGSPFSTVNGIVPLRAFPSSVAYLYPDTPDYYYRYGNGYLYEIDRDTSLIAALLPLLGGGFMPGQYLPNYYMTSPYYGMSSYYPAAYGFNSFYPDYGDDCYRYGNGVIYEVDCFTGLIEDVIPLYAGGYGVGQLLPSSYGYYNVPMQYRPLYFDTPDYGYWYAPGAIYQYDRDSSLITSVAALLSPGFTIGQPLPLGYNMYNVPLGYRSTYYDTPTSLYRYNNGYIYQVDPTTMLVTAIVASILT